MGRETMDKLEDVKKILGQSLITLREVGLQTGQMTEYDARVLAKAICSLFESKSDHCNEHDKFNDECAWCHAVTNEGINWRDYDKPKPDEKLISDNEVKIKAYRLFCQHCQSLQKVMGWKGKPCWVTQYNEPEAVCAAATDAVDGLLKYVSETCEPLIRAESEQRGFNVGVKEAIDYFF